MMSALMRWSLGPTKSDVPVDLINPLPVQVVSGSSGAAATAVAANKPAATAATPLLAANPARKRYLLTNDSTATAYVLEGAGTVSTTSYSFQLTAGQAYTTTDWAGPVSAIWSAANGAMRVTEQTA